MPVNIAAFGPVNGAVKKFSAKLDKILIKQPLSFAIVLGDLFHDGSEEEHAQEVADLLNGVIKLPLPTYFGIGSRTLPSRVVEKLQGSGEVCTNLFFLGRRATLKTSEGVTIASLGGSFAGSDGSQCPVFDNYDSNFSFKDARTLHGAHTADILVTNQWPRGIQTRSRHRLPKDVEPPTEVECISELCSALKPKYHFSTSLVYYSREPFYYPAAGDDKQVTGVTRFESLAPFSNDSKEKWFYAFKYDPSAPPPAMFPTDVTPTPFSPIRKRRTLADQSESYSRFSNGTNDGGRRPRKHRRVDYTKLENCFFCIGSPSLQTHLITSMADDSYLTIPRGPLPPPGWSSDLGVQCHALIIPHTHVDDQAPIDKRAHLSAKEYEEMDRYRRGLCRMIEAKGNGKFGSLCWETSRSHIRHVHWQFMPMPCQLIGEGLVEAGFKVAAEKAELPAFKKYDSSSMVTETGDYFRIWLWQPSGASQVPGLEQAEGGAGEGEDEQGSEVSLVMPIPGSERFDIQFGRKVTAQLLGLGDRADWHDVVQTEEEEAVEATSFKKAFEEYDPFR